MLDDIIVVFLINYKIEEFIFFWGMFRSLFMDFYFWVVVFILKLKRKRNIMYYWVE